MGGDRFSGVIVPLIFELGSRWMCDQTVHPGHFTAREKAGFEGW
jgi:hypothetical protein